MSISRHLPKVFTDWLAFLFTVAMMHIMAFFELLVILPYIDERGSEAYWLHVVFGLFLYVNSVASLYYAMTADSTGAGIVLPSILKPGWRFCSYCEANAPPRSFHCWVCRKCILSRDHHCVFTGNCIGHANRRFYMTLILYVWIAAIYCNFLHIDYVLEMLHGFSLKAVVIMLAPLVAWATGLSEGFKFSVSFISSTSLIACLLIGWLIAYHMLNIVGGQTVHEKASKCRDYDNGWRSNMEVSFGKNWRYAWISPFIPSPLPTDGIEHRKRGSGEDVKDI